MRTSTDFSEWFLGHRKSPYFVLKEHDRRLLYATNCMPHLTFLDYSKLEEDASQTKSQLENLIKENKALREQMQHVEEQLAETKGLGAGGVAALADKLNRVIEDNRALVDRVKYLEEAQTK